MAGSTFGGAVRAPKRDDAPEHSIRVVDAPRKAKDVLAYGEDELERLLRDLVEAGVALVTEADDHQTNIQGALSIVRLAQVYKRQLSESPLPQAIPILAIRQALYDTGVIPYGANISTSPDRAAAKEGESGHARPPYSKELWQGHAPRKALGFSLPGWAVAAAAEDRIDLDALIIIPALIGRPRSEIDNLALNALRQRVGAGVAPPGLLARAGPILLAQKNHNLPALRALADHLASFFRNFPIASEALPELLTGRLAPKSYTRRWRVLDDESVFAIPNLGAGQDDEIRKLSATLQAVNEFTRSGAAALLQSVYFPPPPPPLVDHGIISVSGQVVKKKIEMQPPILYPLVSDKTLATLPASAGKALKKAIEQAQKQYATVLVHLAGEILRIRGRVVAFRTKVPLNYASEVFAAEGLAPVRDLLNGSENGQERAQAYLRKLEEEQTSIRILQALEAASEAQSVRARQYLIIIEQKLGAPRLDAIVRHIQATRADVDTPRHILAAVVATASSKSRGSGKVDTAVIVTEYENLIRQWDLQAANKCPHLGIARALREATAIGEQRKQIGRLREYLPTAGPSSKQEWIPCKSCNFRAICPHALRRVELEIAQAPFEAVQAQLRPYARQVDLTTDPLSSNYAFYCKICGEKLYEVFGNEFDIEGIRRLGNFDDDLKQFLWRTMMHILDPGRGTPPLVRFDRPVDPARFSAEASDLCHPLIHSVRTSPRFPAGSTQRALWRELLAVIYLYAYLFGLALGLPPKTDKLKVSDVVQVQLATAKNNRGKPAPDELAQILLTHLVKSQALAISQLESVTNEQIGNQFRDSYRHIQDTHGRLMITQQSSAALLATNLSHLDPYFALLRRGVELATDTSLWKIHTPETGGRLFTQIMGRSLGDILTEKPPQEYGPFVRSMLTRKGGIEFPSGVNPEWVYHIPALGLFQKSWGARDAKKYWNQLLASSPKVVEPPETGIWYGGVAAKRKKDKKKKTVADGVVSTRRVSASLFWDATYLTILYTISVHDDDSYKAYREVLKLARAREREARESQMYNLLLARNSYSEETAVSPPPSFDLVKKVPLSRLYDENGERHEWTTFLWSAGGYKSVANAIVETVGKKKSPATSLLLTANETKKMLLQALHEGKASPLKNYALTDWVCSTCGVHWSQADQLDEKKVRTRLEAREKLYSFYTYYESRCPEHGMHEFDAATKCGKCDVESDLLTVSGREKDWDRAFAFYTRYKDVFEKLRRLGRGEGLGTSPSIASQVVLVPTATKPTFERNFDSVLELAKSLGAGKPGGQGVAIIEAMGGTEGFTIEEVNSGKKSDPPISMDDPRIVAVDGNIRELLTSYCRYYYTSLREGRGEGLPDPTTLDMEKRYFASVRSAYSQARLAGRNEEKQEKWATGTLGFEIDTFSWLAAELHRRSETPESKKDVLELAREIVRREGLFTIAGDFQWSVFGDAEDTRGVSADDSFGDDARRYGGPSSGAEDILAQNERDYAQGVEGSEGRFSFDAVDMDKSTVEANL
jgi:hypothetical protein